MTTTASHEPLETPSVVNELPTSEAVKKFLAHCRIAKSLSSHTLRAYAADLAHFGVYLGEGATVTRVSRDVLRDYVGTLSAPRRLKESTVKRRLATLKVLFRWLEREDVVALNPFNRFDVCIRLPQRLPRALDATEISRLVQTSETRLARRSKRGQFDRLLVNFIVVTLVTTGLRVGELVAIRIGDVDVNDASIQVRGKGNRERRVYLPGRQASRLLREFVSRRKQINTSFDRLLVTSAGHPVTDQDVRKWLRKLAYKSGITRRVTPHMLRHTAATLLLEADVDIRFVQRLLGHASISTTQLYTHVRDIVLKEKLVRANTLRRLRRPWR